MDLFKQAQIYFSESFGESFFSTEPEVLKSYGKDYCQIYNPSPSIILFPRTTEEVSKVLKYCNNRNLSVIPSGGRTGLCGGALALNKEIILSLDKINFLKNPCFLSRTIEVGAGAITQEVHLKAAGFGLTWPIDLAASGSSQIGGNIATNAGGIRVIKYGTTRKWVLGLTVVLMNGKILKLNKGLEKNNIGPSLLHNFIGSEGILGVITEATLKLTPIIKNSKVLLIGTKNFEEAWNIFKISREDNLDLSAFEYFSRDCLEIVMEKMVLIDPIDEKMDSYVLIEANDSDLNPWMEKLFNQGILNKSILAINEKDKKRIWQYREYISESLRKKAIMEKYDLSVQIKKIPSFVKFLQENIPQKEKYVFGHMGDGNLHINLELSDEIKGFQNMLFEFLSENNGSISAEHGIGLLKKEILSVSRNKAEINLLKKLKRTFDPKNLLNPGKVIDI